MFWRLSAAAALFVLSTVLAAAGSPEGRYRVIGSNPGNGAKYSGTVSVERTGDTYRVTWVIAGQTYTGTGIGTGQGFAVAYRSGSQTGIAYYVPRGNDWDGTWTYTGGRQVGGETWTRR